MSKVATIIQTWFLAEAGKALDQMEGKMASMASERDEERKSLEEKLQQLEELPEQTGGMCLEPISLIKVVEFHGEVREIQIRTW